MTPFKKRLVAAAMMFAACLPCLAQSVMKRDSLPEAPRFPVTKLLIPAAMISYGVTSLENHQIQKWNNNIRAEIVEKDYKHIRIDDYLQYAPAVAVYGLNAAGIKGKHNFKDRTIIYLMSSLIMNTTVSTLKKSSNFERPDGSNDRSFPSGHTANAFLSAEFLHQEYKDVSLWYGVAGYTVAGLTGTMRMYNNRHWLSDVVAGAGIGIASSKLAYWLYPTINRVIFKQKEMKTVAMPAVVNGAPGLALVHRF